MVEVDWPVGLSWVFRAGEGGEGEGIEGCPLGAEGKEGGDVDGHGDAVFVVIGVMKAGDCLDSVLVLTPG